MPALASHVLMPFIGWRETGNTWIRYLKFRIYLAGNKERNYLRLDNENIEGHHNFCLIKSIPDHCRLPGRPLSIISIVSA